MAAASLRPAPIGRNTVRGVASRSASAAECQPSHPAQMCETGRGPRRPSVWTAPISGLLMAPSRDPLASRGTELSERPCDVVDGLLQGDDVLVDLRARNAARAVEYGLRVGLDAITQVLRGGSGPLGPKREG